MPEFNPFDMDLDGDVDGIDFLGFQYLVQAASGFHESTKGPHSWDWDDDEGELARGP